MWIPELHLHGISAWLCSRILVEDWRRVFQYRHMGSIDTGRYYLHDLPVKCYAVFETLSDLCDFWQLNFLKHFLRGGFVKHMQVNLASRHLGQLSTDIPVNSLSFILFSYLTGEWVSSWCFWFCTQEKECWEPYVYRWKGSFWLSIYFQHSFHNSSCVHCILIGLILLLIWLCGLLELLSLDRKVSPTNRNLYNMSRRIVTSNFQNALFSDISSFYCWFMRVLSLEIYKAYTFCLRSWNWIYAPVLFPHIYVILYC